MLRFVYFVQVKTTQRRKEGQIVADATNIEVINIIASIDYYDIAVA